MMNVFKEVDSEGIHELAVMVIGTCSVSQSLTGSKKDSTTRDAGILSGRKFSIDSFHDMPAALDAYVHSKVGGAMAAA